MKQKISKLLISLKEAILRGLIWIFPRLQKLLLGSIILTLFCILLGCGTQRQVTQLIEHSKVDTIYLSNVQYDSIYISRELSTDYRLNPQNPLKQSETDTLYIKDKSIEYRYKLLRDTIYKTRVDSIPYQVTVTEVKEITRPKTTFDIISYWCFGIVVGLILFLLFKLLRRLKLLNPYRYYETD